MKSSLKTVLTAAIVSALVATGAAVATTQAFTLGTTNRVNAPTKVTNLQADGTTVNPVDAALLALENKSSTANATPLSLVAASGHAPFKVNTQTKVAGLNVDLLDGMDSTGFVRGAGKTYSWQTAISRPSTGEPVVLYPNPAVVPGLLNVGLTCPAMNVGPTEIGISFRNLSGKAATVLWQNQAGGTQRYPLKASGLGYEVFTVAALNDITTVSIAGVPAGSAQQVLSVWTVVNSVGDSDCTYRIQALTTNA